MKKLLAFFLLTTATAFAQTPDPLDSIIIESKYVSPQNGACQSAIFKVRVWITNKDSLANITIPFLSNSVSGDAYATVSRPVNCSSGRIFTAAYDYLLPSNKLKSRLGGRGSLYHSNPPDTFELFATLSDPTDDLEKLEPSLTRRPFVDIKFDSVLNNLGQFEIDSTKILANTVSFVNLFGAKVNVNFVKGVINVIQRGDLNADGMLTPADQVLMLNCAFCSACTPPLSGRDICDMNCDGFSTSSDVVLLLNRIFLGTPLPC